MRLIDGDALLRKICGDSCGCEPDECGHIDEYRHERCKAGQYVANAPTVNEWISVKDRLPEDEYECLIIDIEGWYHIGWFKEDMQQWIMDGVVCGDGYITHWIKLPEPPKEDNDALN